VGSGPAEGSGATVVLPAVSVGPARLADFDGLHAGLFGGRRAGGVVAAGGEQQDDGHAAGRDSCVESDGPHDQERNGGKLCGYVARTFDHPRLRPWTRRRHRDARRRPPHEPARHHHRRRQRTARSRPRATPSSCATCWAVHPGALRRGATVHGRPPRHADYVHGESGMDGADLPEPSGPPRAPMPSASSSTPAGPMRACGWCRPAR
jgi:hypothetical protein